MSYSDDYYGDYCDSDCDYDDYDEEYASYAREEQRGQMNKAKSASAFERRVNDYIENVLKDGSCVRIPYGITEIPEGSFKDNQNIKEVYFHENVRYIADSAFENCHKLKKVVFGDALMRIGERAFYRCGMTEINLPKSDLIVGQSAFERCRKLRTINFVDRSKEINTNPYNFEEEYEGNKCDDWGRRAFANCVNLKEIVGFILRSMGEECFAGCKELREVKGNVLEIRDYAFENCHSLKIVELNCEGEWTGPWDTISVILGNYVFPYNLYSLFRIPSVKKYGLGFDGYDENVKKVLSNYERYSPFDDEMYHGTNDKFSIKELADYYGYDGNDDEDYGYEQFLDDL